MGQSAGASSAHLHMMSNPRLSRDLFQSVVMFSGNGNGPYAYVIENPLEQAKSFARAVGIANYSDMKSSELADKLRNTNPADLINACDDMKIWSVDPMTISRPVVEDCEANDGFLCDNPVDLWRTGKQTNQTDFY
jgi:juvenile-hormone esterase